ncbi:MAG: type IX secretion system outer membrane channel protein PorV [Bacteroidota bacterium]
MITFFRSGKIIISGISLLLVLILSNFTIFAQGGGMYSDNPIYINTITTSVPLLLIAPDARAGAMGDAGVASTPDANSIHWNPAKLAFVRQDMGFSVSYTPWLRALVQDINLAYLSGYKRIDKNQVIGLTLLYFSLGDIQFTDEYGNNTIQFNPNEFALDIAYSRKLSDKVSGGMALRYIYSNLTGGVSVGGAESKAGRSIAADVSAYYEDDVVIGAKDAILGVGLNISNIGAKIAYTETAVKNFIPINMRLGGSLAIDIDDFNTISLVADLNKLLVPSPPVYEIDSTDGSPVTDGAGNKVIKYGEDPDRSIVSGIFGSFSDAPGTYYNSNTGEYVEEPGTFKEELREITYSVGLEYWYDKQFAIRVGYFHEHATKGNRKFFTLGAGLKYNVFGIDLAYLIPAYFNSYETQNSPLGNTLRFTLLFDFEAFKDQDKDSPIE